ncbi:LytTR family DNA-binding domain-containing protein [Sphingomonas sp. LY29]|uniref:LytR/AlgR family response regulator transcription factor n=1 Tax=unclassified Sphingomonas TaxID=196159 RepID=UPI002ADEB36A|nr:MULTISPECIES: LytTR family DNA-binding domain-containing protein [unclassified Sphingomonas]MEA1072674.1 LytTR family DNA-binding domain-containing protein [Sphingomonas sp. LY160]WRP24675.1 LytTR family DNA-binding domain-containing protein [Sphingomonas sp. LY29]
MSLDGGAPSDGLRVIVCFRFDPRLPAEVERLKQLLVDDHRTRHSVEVAGSFDFMIEVATPDVPTYHRWTADHAEHFDKVVTHLETSFVCCRYVRRDQQYRDHLWAPTADGLQRIECDTIDLIRAEGDYVRVQCGDRSWLLGTSLCSLSGQLDPGEFLRVHRSTVVNRRAVNRLLHRGRVWNAILTSGEKVRIAKSHVAEVVRMLRDEPATEMPVSATRYAVGDGAAPSTENEMQIVD